MLIATLPRAFSIYKYYQVTTLLDRVERTAFHDCLTV